MFNNEQSAEGDSNYFYKFPANMKNYHENEIGTELLSCAIRVHSTLGPGLFEKVYQVCLQYELEKLGYTVELEKSLPVMYDDKKLEGGFKIDMVIDNKVLVELKCVEEISQKHFAQTLTYLRLSGIKLGYVLNFNASSMKDGIRRIINGQL